MLAFAAKRLYRVIFVCAEMLESPTFALVLHSLHFKALLTGIYVDEAHLVHESQDWRTSYSRIHYLRDIVGDHIPLIAISATLPSTYYQSLVEYIGLKKDYFLINLESFRPELATVIMCLEYDASSFCDLSFILYNIYRLMDIVKTIVYVDDVEMISNLFWHFLSST